MAKCTIMHAGNVLHVSAVLLATVCFDRAVIFVVRSGDWLPWVLMAVLDRITQPVNVHY